MQLDDAYANGKYIADADQYPARWAAEAAVFCKNLGARASLGDSYGPSARQVFDFFASEADAAGTMIFVHGGYWLKFDRTYWSALAQGALARGWNVAMVEYDLCPAVRIDEITDQISRVVTQIAERSDLPISLSGHSAGGHLVARMLAPGVLHPDVLKRVVGVAPISPVADLRPLLQTSMNDSFQMDMQMAISESPVLQPPPDTPVKIWVGAGERPVFLEQADSLAKAWDVAQIVVPEKHHFDIIDMMKEAESDVIRFLTP
ncbi:MAG: alpha/beta hydrolase [Roseobacter sp.]